MQVKTDTNPHIVQVAGPHRFTLTHRASTGIVCRGWPSAIVVICVVVTTTCGVVVAVAVAVVLVLTEVEIIELVGICVLLVVDVATASTGKAATMGISGSASISSNCSTKPWFPLAMMSSSAGALGFGCLFFPSSLIVMLI
jgi:hypothetical protein